MENKLNSTTEMASKFYAHLHNAFLDEEDRSYAEKIELKEDVTDMFTGLLIAFHVMFVHYSVGFEGTDLIDFIGILNKLAYQYMLESAKDE